MWERKLLPTLTRTVKIFLGRKLGPVLSKVSHALIKFLSPLSTALYNKSNTQLASTSHEKLPDRNPTPEQFQVSEKVEELAPPIPVEVQKSPFPPPPQPTLQNFVQPSGQYRMLMQKLLGNRIYPTAARKQKSASKLRKGIILDRKAD